MRKDEDKVLVTSPDSLALYAESKGLTKLVAYWEDNYSDKWYTIFDIAQMFLNQHKTR